MIKTKCMFLGPVDSGLPPFQPPPFSTVVHNKTLSFFDMTSRLESALIAVPMVSVLEHIAIAKAFGKCLHTII